MNSKTIPFMYRIAYKHGSDNETREICLLDSYYAYKYADRVDKKAQKNTENAVKSDYIYYFYYRKNIKRLITTLYFDQYCFNSFLDGKLMSIMQSTKKGIYCYCLQDSIALFPVNLCNRSWI